jgi:glycosyltransferase involved in cell wall biosynthesis
MSNITSGSLKRHVAGYGRDHAMRVALITPRFLPDVGGLEVHVGSLARRLVAAGHSVEVMTQASPSARRLDLLDGATVRRFPIWLGGDAYPFAPGLWNYIWRHAGDFDVVHVHSYHATPAIAAALAPARRLVFTPHYLGGGRTLIARAVHVPYRFVGRIIFRRADHVVCTTAAEAAMIARDFPGAIGKTVVIPNGIDVELINRAVSQDRAGRVILCAGRLEEYKNTHLVVAAIPFLDQCMKLVIVGDGPAAGGLARLATELGVASRVELAGAVRWPEVYGWFRTADVFVTMSARESYGMTVLEAHVAGARVVASDIPAHRELIAILGPEASLVPISAGPAELAGAIRAAAAAASPPGTARAVPSWDDHVQSLLRIYSGG